MSSVVFDVETVAMPLGSFDDAQREYLLRNAETDEERDAELQKLSLHALTARVVAIAMVNPDTMGGKVLYQSDVKERFVSDSVEYSSGDEASMLKAFWETIRQYDRFITFNGRSFDCPFILLRSAILRIPPTRNLMPYRYATTEHCDLMDQLTFYGATRKFTLDFYCKAFGIRSPKSEGIAGPDVGPLFAAGRTREIADYCLRDVMATSALFKVWNEFLSVKT